MKNRRLFISLGLLILLLAYFNPEQKDFHAYVQRKVAKAGGPGEKPIRDLVAGISEDALKAAQKEGAVRKNYVVFSIFEIENPTDHKVHKILGLVKNFFIPLNESPKWKEVKADFGG